ncbi:unnamed protein product [Protopolystoma xenopodis]|uniref:Uncharacterized protein n=1 Tax=Protopolystoma xenopodis TaxID=117903 RepID=A0A3S5BLA4_9PLAT|nr:unnamed protein product [Protopolystoma xenopodis]
MIYCPFYIYCLIPKSECFLFHAEHLSIFFFYFFYFYYILLHQIAKLDAAIFKGSLPHLIFPDTSPIYSRINKTPFEESRHQCLATRLDSSDSHTTSSIESSPSPYVSRPHKAPCSTLLCCLLDSNMSSSREGGMDPNTVENLPLAHLMGEVVIEPIKDQYVPDYIQYCYCLFICFGK